MRRFAAGLFLVGRARPSAPWLTDGPAVRPYNITR